MEFYMKGLLLKELLILKGYIKILIILFGVLSAVSWVNGENMGGSIIIMMFMILAITSFSLDEHAKWDVFVLTTPVARKSVVLSKYILSVILISAGALIALLISFLIETFAATGDFSEQLLVIYAMALTGFIFISVMLPILYKFGVEKGRIVLFLVCFSPVILSTILAKSNIRPLSDAVLSMSLWFAPLIVLPLICLSFYISYRIYLKIEF